MLKFIYSGKATNFCEISKISKISTVDLSYVLTVKSTVKISQNFAAFSEYMNLDFKESQFLKNFRHTNPFWLPTISTCYQFGLHIRYVNLSVLL